MRKPAMEAFPYNYTTRDALTRLCFVFSPDNEIILMLFINRFENLLNPTHLFALFGNVIKTGKN